MKDTRTKTAKILDKKANARLHEKLTDICLNADISKIEGGREEKIAYLTNLIDEKINNE